jgi:hypothetical protein
MLKITVERSGKGSRGQPRWRWMEDCSGKTTVEVTRNAMERTNWNVNSFQS